MDRLRNNAGDLLSLEGKKVKGGLDISEPEVPHAQPLSRRGSGESDEWAVPDDSGHAARQGTGSWTPMSDFDGSPSPPPPSPPPHLLLNSEKVPEGHSNPRLPVALNQQLTPREKLSPPFGANSLMGGLIISSKSTGNVKATPPIDRPPLQTTSPVGHEVAPPLAALEPLVRPPPGIDFPTNSSSSTRLPQSLSFNSPKSKIKLDSLGALVTEQEEIISGTQSPARSSSVPKGNLFDHVGGFNTLSSHRAKPLGLPPAKQRAAQILSSINSSTLSKSPNFSPSSVMAAALSYSLPPPPLPSVSPPSSNPTAHNPANVGVIHLGAHEQGRQSALSQPFVKLPFHFTSQTNTAIAPTLTQPISQFSVQGAYTFDVPKDVKTGVDAVRLFSSSAAKPGLLIYCNLADPSGRDAYGYNPYELLVVPPEQADSSLHFVISQSGVTLIEDGQVEDLVLHHDWIRDRHVFSVLKKLVVFKKPALFHAFRKWSRSVRDDRFERNRKSLQSKLLMLSPAYGKALLNIHRLTSLVWEDPANRWVKEAEAGSNAALIAYQSRLATLASLPSDHHPGAVKRLKELGTLKPKQLAKPQSASSRWALRAAPVKPFDVVTQTHSSSGPFSAKSLKRMNTLKYEDPSASLPSVAFVTISNVPITRSRVLDLNDKDSTAAGRDSYLEDEVDEDDTLDPNLRTKQLETLILGTGDVSFSKPQASFSIASKVSDPRGPFVKKEEPGCPNFFQALCDEPVPTGGIPVSLGHIGSLSDQYSIAEFKQLRSHARTSSSAALHESAQAVVKIIQQVGANVQQRVTEATRQAAKSTRKEVRERKFELNLPSAYSPNAKDEEVAKARNLRQAKADKERFVHFLSLVEAFLLKHMTELGRSAYALLCHQAMAMQRQSGLLTIDAMIDMAEMSMMGLARRQQDGGPPMIQQRTSLKRTLSRGSGTFKREQSLRGLTDAPLLTPCIILSPNAEEFLSCVVECVKDVLTVTAWGARPLTTYPDVKSMLKDMFGSSLGLSPTKAPASQLTQDRLLTLPGPERPLSKGKEALHTAEGPTRLRTLSFGIMQNFSSAAVNESNASAPASHADVDDDFNADDPLGVLKGNFGGGLSQSLPRVSSMKGGSSCRHSSGTIAPLPAYSPYEVIKRVLGVVSLQEELEARCKQQYGNALRHQGLRPYVGHRDELALIGSFDQAHVLESASTFAATLPPGSLHSDIILLRDWAEDMAGPGGQRSSLTSGLLQFNLEVLRSTLLPITCKAYAGYMSKIASSLTSSIKELREQVEKYIVMLRRRPSDLDSFVEFIEETYQHLDDNGDLRLAVITSKEQISSLYEVLRAAVPQVPSTFDDRSPSAGRLKQTQSLPLSIHVNETHHANQQQGAAAMSSLSAATGGMIGPGGAILVTNVTARDARPVFQQWKQAQSDINRYHDECLAAREFFESSSALMASHLKADLAEMETEASHILNDLRMGRSTSSQLSPTEAQFELIRLDENLSSLKTHLARFHAWMKLLGNQPGVKTILLETEEMVLCAATHLESRTSFWRAVAEWEHVLDRLHSKRCFGKGPQADLSSDNDSEEENRSAKRWFGPLVDQLESKMIALDKVVTEISLKHVDADVKNTMTATPPESSLAARFAVVVKSYKSMLPYAKALSQPGVTERHLSILLQWIRVSHSQPTIASAKSPAGASSDDLYPIPIHSYSVAADYVDAQDRDVTASSLISRSAENTTTRALVDRVVSLALAEDALRQKLSMIQDKLSTFIRVDISSQRTFGAFTFTNLEEVLTELSALDIEVSSLRSSPFLGGVLPIIEDVEMSLSWITCVIKGIDRCFHHWIFFNRLFQNCPEAQPLHASAPTDDLSSQWLSISTTWRMLMLGSKEGNRGSVSSMAVLFHEIEIIEEAFRKLYVRAMSEICTIVREKCARLAFVPDRIILEAASDVDCTSCSSLNSLLSFCFMGMESVIVSSIADNERLNAARDTTHPLILPGGASASRTKSQDGDLMRREFVEQRHFVSSVMGVSGGRLLLDPSAESFTRLGPGTSLATLVSGLDGTLRKSFLGATRSCLEACGRMQVDEWVGYFPARCILLVDACAWTQTAASALSRLQQGERTAMRVLYDQSVLRLETMSKQVRGLARDSGFADPGSQLNREKRMGLETLIMAGVSHRRVVEDLQASDAIGSDGFEWLRQVRHYWDPDANEGTGGLLVMFSQTRLQYGFEYDGKRVEAVPLMLLATENGLLSAINALQTSPLVSLGLSKPAMGQGSCKEVVASLASLAGKLHLSFNLTPDSTSSSTAAILSNALRCDAWLSLDGVESLGQEVLAVFSSQIYRIWQSFFFGTGHVNLMGRGIKDSDHVSILSPWDLRQKWQSRAHEVECWGPFEGPGMSCAIFLAVPLSHYLAPYQELTATQARSLSPSHLSEALRRCGRMISLPVSLADPGPALEAGLKSMGLRDASEATKCASCVIKFSQLQLHPRPHYNFGLRLVRSLLSHIQKLWLPSYVIEEGNLSVNAIEAIEQALRVVLLGMCDGQDASLVSRLIEQVFSSAKRTQAAMVGQDERVSNSSTPLSTTVSPLQLQGLINFMCSSSAASSSMSLTATAPMSPMSPSRASTQSSAELSSPLPAKSASRLAKDSKSSATPMQGSSSTSQINPGLPSPPPVAMQHAFSGALSHSLQKSIPQTLLQASIKELLGPTVVSLHSALFSSESTNACFLIGPAGSGKTFLWKTLISALNAASQGRESTYMDDPLSDSASIIRIYPESMPLLPSLAKNRALTASKTAQPLASRDIFSLPSLQQAKASSFPSLQLEGDISASWLSPLLEGSVSFNLPSSDKPLEANADLRSWVIVDGPIGTSAAESLTPFLRGQVYVGNDLVVGLRKGSKMIWECDNLATASPSLLTSVPIVHMPSGVLDPSLLIQEGIVKSVKKFLANSTNAQLSTSSKSAATISRFACNLVLTLLQEVDALIKDPSSSVSVDPLNDHLSVLPPSLPSRLSSSWFNLFGGHSGSARTFNQILAEVLRTLEPPSQSSQAQTQVSRAALFALHWTVVPLVMSETSRNLLLDALTAAALYTPDFASLLPYSSQQASKEKQFLQGYLLTPKSGEWMSWKEALDEFSRSWKVGKMQAFTPFVSGAVHSDQGPMATFYHIYEAPGGGSHIYLPSATSVSFQYVFGLSLRAGLHPVVVGHSGSGKKSLTDHMLSCWSVFGQFSSDVIRPTTSQATAPSQYHSLLMSCGSVQALRSDASPSISPASWGVQQRCFRPRTGHQVVLLIQDLHVLPSNTNRGCLEWLRRLLDDSSSTDSTQQGSRVEVHGVSAAFTTTPLNFVAGPDQVSPRLWRHMHHLHLDSSPANSVFSLINHNHVLEAHCHAALTNITTRGGMTSFSQASTLNAAAKVLSSLISDTITCTSFLYQARVVPRVSFNVSAAVSLLSRVEAAAASSYDELKRPWTPTSLMLRLIYEVGRDIGYSLPCVDAMTFSRLLIRVSGRELGAFIGSGKFLAAARARDRNIEQKIKDLGSGPATVKALHFDSQDETWLNDWQSSLDPILLESPLTLREVLLHWSDYHAGVVTEAEAMKSLAVGLVGRLNASEIDELLHAFTLDANEAREALGAALALTQPPPLTPAFFQGSAKRAVGGLESILAGGVAKVSAYFPPWLSPRKVQVDSPAHAPANLQDVKRQWLPQQLSLVRTVLDNLVSEHADSTASDHDSFLMEGVRSSTLDRWGCAEAFGIALRVLSSPSSNGLMLVGQKSLLQGFDNPAVQVATLAAKASGCKPILIQALQAMPAPLMVAQQIRDVLDQHPNYVKDPPIALIITPSAADDLVTMELLNRLLTWPSQVAASISTSDGIDPTVCSYGTSYSHAYVSNMADILLHSQFKAKVDDATRRSSMRRSESQNGMSSSHSTPRSAGQENTADDEAALHSESTNRPSHRPSLINNGVDSGAFLRPALEGHRHGLGFALSRVEASRSERIKRAGALADIAQALKKGLKIIVVAGSSSQATRLQQSFPALFHRTSSHLPPGSDNVTSTCWISVSISADGGDQIPKETKASRIGVALGAVAPFVSAVLAVSQADRPSATSSSPVPLIDTSFVNSASNLDATGAAETMLRQARLRLSSALETIHDRTQSLFVDKRLLRVDAPLPESMIYDLAVALESIHNAQYKGLRARRAELSSVLSKLSKGKASNVRGPSPAKALETKVQEIEKSLSRFKDKVKEVDNFIEALAAEVLAQETLVDKTRYDVNKVHLEVDAQLDKALTSYGQATSELVFSGPNESELAEIKSYQNPPEAVKLVVMSLCIVFERPVDWKSCQSLLSDLSSGSQKGLAGRLMELSPSSLPPLTIAKLTRLTQEPDFNVVTVARVSKACKSICWWAITLASLIAAQRDADIKLEKIEEAEQRLLESDRYARKLKGELLTAQQDREQLIKAMNKCEDVEKELLSRIADRQAASLRADLLGQKAEPITQMWLQEMEDLDEQLASLLGDSLVSACLAVYGGPMHSSERKDAVRVWRECIEQSGLSVCSNSFCLDTFLWRRQRQLTGGMKDHALAAVRSSGWIEPLLLVSLAVRPPLIIDDCHEAMDLVQEMNHGLPICNLDIREDNVVAKAAKAIEGGAVVIVQIHQPGSSHEVSVMSAISFVCSRFLDSNGSSAPPLPRLIEPAEQDNSESLPRMIGHRLYFRSLSLGSDDDDAGGHGFSPTMLSPDLLRVISPVLFSYERHEMSHPSLSQSPLLLPKDTRQTHIASSQFSRKVTDVLIQSLLGIDASAEIREAKGNAWEALRNAEEISNEIIRMLASSPEDIWSLPSLIDATVDKMAYLSKVIQRLPSFDSRVKAMEYLPEGYQSLVKAALLCWDALKSMAANCDHPHSFISDSAFFSLFKAAIKKALSSAERGDATLTLEDSLNIRSSTSSAASFESEKDKSTTSRRLPSAVLSRAGSSAGDEEPHMKPVPASFNLVDPLYPDPPSTETFLSTFLPLLSATLTPTRTQALRLMVSLRALSDEALHSRLDKEKRERIVYSQPELSFACAVFEQGVMGFGAETALAMAGLIVSPSKHSDSSSKQPGAEDVVQEGTPSKMMFLDKIKKAVHAAAMSKVLKGDGRNKSEDTQFVEDHEEEVEQQAVAPHDPTHVAAWLASTTPRLHWLEKLFPKPEVFRGIESAVKSNPDLWHQALHSLSHYCGYVREGEGPEGDDIVAPYSWRRRLGSLHWLLLVAVAVPHRISVACEALLCRHILGGPQDSMTPGDTLLVALQSTPASCPLLLTTTGCSDALDAIRQAQSCFAAGHSPLPPQPDDLGLQSTQVTVKHWDAADISYSSDAKERAIAEVTKAIKDHRWLVVLNAHSAPSLVLDMLHALSQSSYLIRGEGARSFRLFLATPHPALFVHPSQAIPLTVRAQSMRVVISPFWGQATAMGAAAGSGCAAKLTLRAACQTLAHPHASYLGFYSKDTPQDIQTGTLATVLAMSCLSRTLKPSDALHPVEDPLHSGVALLPDLMPPTLRAPIYNTWDLFHAVQSTKLVLMATAAQAGESKKRRTSVSKGRAEDVDPGGLDYVRLVDVLLPDVLLAPASFCAADSSWGNQGDAMGGPGSGDGSLSFSRVYAKASRLSRRLISPGAFSSTSYPVRKALVDEKAAVTAYQASGHSSSSSEPPTPSVLGVIAQKGSLNEEPEVSEPFPFKPTPSSVLSFVNLLLPTEFRKEMVPVVDPRLLGTWSTFFVLEGAGSSGRKKMGRGISVVVRAVVDLKEGEEGGLKEEETVIKSSIEVPVCYPATLERLTGNPALPAASQEVISSSLQLSSFVLSIRPTSRSCLPGKKTDQAQELKSRVALEGATRKARANRWSHAQSSALKTANQARNCEMTMGQELLVLASAPPSSAYSKSPSAQPRSSFSLQALLLEMWLSETRVAEEYCSSLARQAGRRLLLMARCEPEQAEHVDVDRLGLATRLLDHIAQIKGTESGGTPASIDLVSMSNPSSFFSVLIRGFAHERSINSLSHVALQASPLNPANSRTGFFLTSVDEPQANIESAQQGFIIKGSAEPSKAMAGYVAEARFCFEDGNDSDECFIRPSRPNLPTAPLPDLLLMPVFIDPATTTSAVLPHLRRGRKEAQEKSKPPVNLNQSIVRAPVRVTAADHPAISVILDVRHQADVSDASPNIMIR